MAKVRLSLAEAVFANKKDVVRKLLAEGADAQQRDNGGRTPLHYASMVNELDLVDWLLKAGAKADVSDGVGDVPLHFAAQHPNRLRVLERLIEVAPAMANQPGAVGRLPLCMAVAAKWPDGVARLLAAGADPRKQDGQGRTAVDWATNAKVRALLEGRAAPAAPKPQKASKGRRGKPVVAPTPSELPAPFVRVGDTFEHTATKLPFVYVPGGTLRTGPSDRAALEAIGLDEDAVAELTARPQTADEMPSLLVAQHPLLDQAGRPRQFTRAQAAAELKKFSDASRPPTDHEWEWLARTCGRTILIGAETADAAEEACASLAEDDAFSSTSGATSALGIWGLLLGEWVATDGGLAGISGAASGYPFEGGDVVGACLACVGPRPAKTEKLALRLVYTVSVP